MTSSHTRLAAIRLQPRTLTRPGLGKVLPRPRSAPPGGSCTGRLAAPPEAGEARKGFDELAEVEAAIDHAANLLLHLERLTQHGNVDAGFAMETQRRNVAATVGGLFGLQFDLVAESKRRRSQCCDGRDCTCAVDDATGLATHERTHGPGWV